MHRNLTATWSLSLHRGKYLEADLVKNEEDGREETEAAFEFGGVDEVRPGWARFNFGVKWRKRETIL